MSIFFVICLLHFVAQLTPGPDIFLIAKSAVSESYQHTLKIIAGIACGIFVWVVLTLIGFSVLIQQIPWMQDVLMLIGGAFLLRLGFLMLKGGLAALGKIQNLKSDVSLNSTRPFLLGLATNLSNPKTLIYFSSVFSLALSSQHSAQLAFLLAVWIPVQTFITFALFMLLLSHHKMKQYYQRFSAHIDVLSGVVFIFFAVLLWWEVVNRYLFV